MRPIHLVLAATLCLALQPGWCQKPPAAGRRGADGFNDRSPKVGEQAPDFELRNGDGSPVRLWDYQGHWVVLEFFTPDVVQARDKTTSMDRLRGKYTLDQVRFVAVTGEGKFTEDGIMRRTERPDKAEMREAITAGAAKAGEVEDQQLHGAVVLSDSVINHVRMEYGGGANMAYIIDPKGRIQLREMWLDPNELERNLDALLGQPDATKVADYRGDIQPEVKQPTRAQVAGSMRGMRVLTSQGVDAYFTAMDADKDGFITQQESGMPSGPFTRADEDANDKLDRTEVEQMKEFAAKRMQERGIAPDAAASTPGTMDAPKKPTPPKRPASKSKPQRTAPKKSHRPQGKKPA